MWLVGAPALIAGCAIANEPKTGKASSQPLTLSAGTRVNIEGILDYGTAVFAENPTTLLEAGDFHGYELDGQAGGVVTITMNASNCGAPDTFLDLFGPEDANGDRGMELAENDDAGFDSCFTDSQIQSFTLPVDETYLLVERGRHGQHGGRGRRRCRPRREAVRLEGPRGDDPPAYVEIFVE